MSGAKSQAKAEGVKSASAARAQRTGKRMTPVIIQSHHTCKSCSMLPVGSVELTSLLLVLVFSLVSVLLTSVFALNSEHQKVAALEAQVAATQQ